MPVGDLYKLQADVCGATSHQKYLEAASLNLFTETTTIVMRKINDESRPLPVWSGSSFSVIFTAGGKSWLIWLPIVDIRERAMKLDERSVKRSFIERRKMKAPTSYHGSVPAQFCIAQSRSIGLLSEKFPTPMVKEYIKHDSAEINGYPPGEQQHPFLRALRSTLQQSGEVFMRVVSF